MKRVVLCCLAYLVLAVPIALYGQSPAEKLQVQLPGKTWIVMVDSPGFVVKSNGPKGDGRQYLLASNDKNGLNLSVTLERSPNGADAGTCPQYLRKRVEGLSGLGLKDIRYFTVNTMAAAEYLIPEVKGYKIEQENIVACTARDDVYIDIHLSKIQFTREDEQLLRSLMDRISIIEVHSSATAQPDDVARLFAAGSRYYLQQKYKEAIPSYQQALDLEKKERRLDKNMWRVLVDNLGMAYGVTGDLAKAEATFRYGLAEDATYPMFSYNMACVYAERNDLDNAMAYLKTAFDYKDYMIGGEKMPDPRSDDSFQRFLNNPKFRALVESLQK